MLVEGLFLPLTTPFSADGRVNLLKLEHNVALYSKTPAAGLVVLGSNGEATLLTEEEAREVMRASIESAAAEKVMLADVSKDSVAATVGLAEYAARLGYDAVVVGVPSILRGEETRKELKIYFEMVADRSPLPLMLASGVDAQHGRIDENLVVSLARHCNVLGVVDAAGGAEAIAALKAGTADVDREVMVTAVFTAVTGRMVRQNSNDGSFVSVSMLSEGPGAVATLPARPAIKTRTKRVGFQILSGSSARMLEGLREGARGAVPRFGVCAPQACFEVLAAWKDSDEGLAAEKQARIVDAATRIEAQTGVAGIKYGCDLNGYYGGWTRLPFLPLCGEERSLVELLMQGIRS